MLRHFFKWKWIAVALFSLLATACAAPTVWKLDIISGSSATWRAARLSHKIDNIYRDVQLELISSNGAVRAHFNVFCIPLVPSEEGCVMVAVDWKDQRRRWRLPLLAGGHRLLLSEEYSAELMEALEQGNSLEVTIGRYRSEIPSCSFKSAYANFCSLHQW